MTDKEVTDTFVAMLASELDDFRRCIAELPDDWLQYLKDCSVCGLRGAILNAYELDNE